MAVVGCPAHCFVLLLLLFELAKVELIMLAKRPSVNTSETVRPLVDRLLLLLTACGTRDLDANESSPNNARSSTKNI